MTGLLGGILAGCDSLPQVRLQLGAGDVSPFYTGMIAADEPEAVMVARDILKAGGTATDAAAAMGLALSVTLPSSAGLGGSGACIVHDSVSGTTEALDFTARAGEDKGAARYRSAIPALARGLFALHAKYGKLPWAQVVAPAENLARFGHKVSRAFAQDLAADGGALVNDRTALTTFMTPRRQTLQVGDTAKQPDLATTLGRLREHGPSAFYTGTAGHDVEDAIATAGGAITIADMESNVPTWVAAAGFDDGAARVYVLPKEVGGGEFKDAFDAAPPQSPADEFTTAGATSFVVSDNAGGAVACGFDMGKPFGTGMMPTGMGFLLAPSPEVAPRHPLASVIAVNRSNNKLIFAAAAAGSEAIPRTAVVAKATIVERHKVDGPVTARRSGLVNMLTCDLDEHACLVQSDPAGAGYAVVLNSKK